MNWTYIRRTILMFLIFSSLVLSWALWTMPGEYAQQRNRSQNNLSSVTFNRQYSRVFGPAQVVLHSSEGAVMTNKRSILTPLERAFTTWGFENIEEAEAVPAEEYQQLLQAEVVELLFPGFVPFGLFDNLFDSLPSEIVNSTFNKVLLSLSNPSQITFYNTQSGLLYRSELSGVTQGELQDILQEGDSGYYPVFAVKGNRQFFYLPSEEQSFSHLTYLVERQPNSLFINRLFEDTSEVQTTRTDTTIRYTSTSFMSEIRINEETNILNYYRNRASGSNLSLAQSLEDSFNELILYENWTEEVHFFGYDAAANESTFRRYINGFPVFGDVEYGVTKIGVVSNGLVTLQVPLVVAQTPIEDTESQKILMDGDTLLHSLEDAGYNPEEITDIQIGYTWTNSSESSRVIHLDPVWYINMEGTWLSYEEMLQEEGGQQSGL